MSPYSNPGPRNGNWKDGRTWHPLYNTYWAMRCRCENPNDAAYDRYGGRGIYVCQRWRDDFWAFVADMGNRPEGHSLDRIDNDGPYSPDNCRWATAAEQNANKRAYRVRTHCNRGHEFTARTTYVTKDGRRKCRTCHNAWARARRTNRKKEQSR